MLDCKHVSRLLSQAQETTLPWGVRVQLWLHLRVCEACVNFSRQLGLLRRAMRRYRQ
jgi:hypothetical protein